MSLVLTTSMISADNARGSDLPSVKAQSEVGARSWRHHAYSKQRVAQVDLAGEWKPVLIVTAAGLLILLPIIIWGIPSGGDLANHYRFALPVFMIQFAAAHSIRAGWQNQTMA